MRKTRAVINTPIGKVFTVDLEGKPYFNIKEVCAGIGLRGHSPWSWHAERGNNRQLYYKRYSTQRRTFTFHANGHGSITMISVDGLIDYLRNPRLRNGLAVMFKAWLESTYMEKSENEQYLDDLARYGVEVADAFRKKPDIPKDQISMDQHEASRDIMPEQPLHWKVKYYCPICGFEVESPSKFCPECGKSLVA